jgi:hypothetical protein
LRQELLEASHGEKHQPGKNVASPADAGNDHGKKNAAFAATPAYPAGHSLDGRQALRSNAYSTCQTRACNMDGRKGSNPAVAKNRNLALLPLRHTCFAAPQRCAPGSL